MSLSLSSNQNDTVSSSHVVENEVQPSEQPAAHHQEKDRVDPKKYPMNMENLDSVELSPAVTADNSHKGILPTILHPIVSDE